MVEELLDGRYYDEHRSRRQNTLRHTVGKGRKVIKKQLEENEGSQGGFFF